MEPEGNISRQKRSKSRDQFGANFEADSSVASKEASSRGKCPDCDGKTPKDGNKSRSRVWKKVMWFTRRSRGAKSDKCQCQNGESFFNSGGRHSNTWSFTRSASRKFRISSRQRQCKSESSKKPFRAQVKNQDTNASQDSSQASTRAGSLCSTGTNSPTATGSFCDFGASTHTGGRGPKSKQKNAFVLTEIAREINPPVRDDVSSLGNVVHTPPKKLSKSSSSVSHISRSCQDRMQANVRRSKSFPGSQTSPSKRRFINNPNKPFSSFSPPLKQKCYGLRRTATFSGKLNTEFPKLSIKKSMSVNNAQLTNLEKTTSCGEIRDQSGSIVGIVNFYKSPKKLARKTFSSFSPDVKRDQFFAEEEIWCDPSSSKLEESTGSIIADTQRCRGPQKGVLSNLCTLGDNSKTDRVERDDMNKGLSFAPSLSNINEKKSCIAGESVSSETLPFSVQETSFKIDHTDGSSEINCQSVNLEESFEVTTNSIDRAELPTHFYKEKNTFDLPRVKESLQEVFHSNVESGCRPTNDKEILQSSCAVIANEESVTLNVACAQESGICLDYEDQAVEEVQVNTNDDGFSGTNNVHGTSSTFGTISAGSLMVDQELSVSKAGENEPKCTSSCSENSHPTQFSTDEHQNSTPKMKCASDGCSFINECVKDTADLNQSSSTLHSKEESVSSSNFDTVSETVDLPCPPSNEHVSLDKCSNGVHDQCRNPLLTQKVENPSISITAHQKADDIYLPCCRDEDQQFTDQQYIPSMPDQRISGEGLPQLEREMRDGDFVREPSSITDSHGTDVKCECGSEFETSSIRDTSFSEISENCIRGNHICQSDCLGSELEITEKFEGLMAPDVRDLEFPNEGKLRISDRAKPSNDFALEMLDSSARSVRSSAEQRGASKGCPKDNLEFCNKGKLSDTSCDKPCIDLPLEVLNRPPSRTKSVNKERVSCKGGLGDDLRFSDRSRFSHSTTSACDTLTKSTLEVLKRPSTCADELMGKQRELNEKKLADHTEFPDGSKFFQNSAGNNLALQMFESASRCVKLASGQGVPYRISPNDELKFTNEGKSSHASTSNATKSCDDLTSDVFNTPSNYTQLVGDQEYCRKTSASDVSFSPDNSENVGTVPKLSTIHSEFQNCVHTTSMVSSSESLECSRTSDYASVLNESIPYDVPIHTWKTSESSDMKSDEIGLPVPGEMFKIRTELLLSWFEEFNDEQRNIILKKILNRCDLPQMHLLSVAMENNLHKTCPPNCQDMLVWLPYTVTFKILMYLDPVSLCRCNQVNRAWNELTDNPLLWQRLTRNPDYQLSESSSRRQYQKFTQSSGEIHWKKVFAERFLLQRNWLNGKYKLRTFEGHNQGIACVQFDDTRIVSGSSDKTIKLWDISNTPSELMLTLEGHSGTVRCLDLNGNRLVSGSTDRTIKVWDLSFASYWAGASCKVTMVGHLHTVRCLQADEKKLVSGSYDKTVKVWDLKTGECQLTLRGHTAAVLCVQFDDQKIVSGSYDKKIKVWDLTEGTCLMTLDGHQDAVTCLNLTHDGMKIITGSLDYSLKFWDLSTGKCYGTLDWITSEGHTAVVRCLQVDSWRIVSGGDDKTLKVWELATGQRLLTLRYHSDGVTCMQFNDFAIVSGSYDRTVKLWDFTPKHSYLEAITL